MRLSSPETSPREDVWVVSRGSFTELDLSAHLEGCKSVRVKEYDLSDLGRYLLSPDRIMVRKKLVGCEVQYVQPPERPWREAVRKRLPARFQPWLPARGLPPEVLMSHFELRLPHLRDPHLEAHLNRLYAGLRPYDAILRRLSRLEPDRLADLIGICEDSDGNRSRLTLSGTVEEKLEYVESWLLRDVGVVLNRAHVADGLFELEGFDFRAFQPTRASRLLTFLQGGRYRGLVLKPDGALDFQLDDIRLVQYMHLLEQSIESSPTLRESLRLAVQGRARPNKLLITRKLEFKYSRERLPATYRDLFSAIPLGTNETDAVVRSLNHSQLTVSLNYVPKAGADSERMVTSVAVLHDFKALEPLKNDLPELYSELSRRAPVSDAGRYYLLDSIRGYSHEG